MKKKFFTIILLLVFNSFYAQINNRNLSLGFYYGFGQDINNKDYFYDSHHYKFELSYSIRESKNFKYELVVQPQMSFVKHQLLNLEYVGSDVPNYMEKREKYGKLKVIKDYILNVGLTVSKPVSEKCNVFVVGSIGPMITDTETERLSKGFAFSSVLSLGVSLKVYNSILELRPNFNHISNAGLQKLNNGFSTFNLEFGLKFPL